jgi:hypothetical protein
MDTKTIFLLLIIASLYGSPAFAMQPVDYWEQQFLNAWQAEYDAYLPKSTGDDSWDYYNLAYAVDANAAMFAATDKSKYLDRALLYIRNVMASARVSSNIRSSQYRDSCKGWVSQRDETKGQEIPLYESYFWRYVCRLLRLMHESPPLSGNSDYRKQFDEILAFSEVNVFRKWYGRGLDNLYRVNTHMASHWAYIGMELWRLSSDQTWKARYHEVFTNINLHIPTRNNSSLRGQFIFHPEDPSTYFWSADWGSYARPGQDVSHGNNLLAYLVEAHDLGVEWNDEDMMKFCNTLVKHVWPTSSKYAGFVDGSGTGNGWFNDGFCKLGRYNRALQERLESHKVGRNTQLFGNMAENAKRLANLTHGLPRSGR